MLRAGVRLVYSTCHVLACVWCTCHVLAYVWCTVHVTCWRTFGVQYMSRAGVRFLRGRNLALAFITLQVQLLMITYLLTPWCTALLEKITGLQLVKKFSAFYGTRRFMNALTSVRLQREHPACKYFLKWMFYREGLLAPRPTPHLEDHPLSAVHDCLFNLFAATLHIGGRSSIRNPRTRHAVVTGTHYTWTVTYDYLVYLVNTR